MMLQELKESLEIGDACLRDIRDLRTEMADAVNAIAENRLPKVEESLWRQEMLCASLRRSLLRLGRAAPSKDLLVRLRDAFAKLQSEAAGYESLVRQSSRTSSLLGDLCGLYAPMPQQVRSSRLCQISCEA